MRPYSADIFPVRYSRHGVLLAFVLMSTLSAPSVWPSERQPIPNAALNPDRTEAFSGTPVLRDRADTHYDWKAPPARNADWRGIMRDTGYFIGYQFAAIGVLYVAPESVSDWSDEQKQKNNFAKWKRNAGNPTWDDDTWWINYVLHPYWGGVYYVRARERGFDDMQSFAYSTLLSTLFEFGAEALFEQPSYQDLIVTPVAGYVLGRYLFMPLRDSLRERPGAARWTEKATLFLTDPMGVTNAAIDRMFGIGTHSNLHFGPVAAGDRPAVGDVKGNRYTSLRAAPRGWILQLRVTW